jgi:hypothetical protein
MAGRGEAFGMMDAAFFVGKNELLTWLNETLQLNYTKVRPWPSRSARIPVPSPPTAPPSVCKHPVPRSWTLCRQERVAHQRLSGVLARQLPAKAGAGA